MVVCVLLWDVHFFLVSWQSRKTHFLELFFLKFEARNFEKPLFLKYVYICLAVKESEDNNFIKIKSFIFKN